MRHKVTLKRVAFAIDPGNHPDIQEGVFEYAHLHGWTLVLNPYQAGSTLDWVRQDQDVDGVIGFIAQADLPVVKALGVPVVSVSDTGDPSLPTVTSDGERIGALAAEHLIQDKRFRRLGFIGRHGLPFSENRRRGFTQAAETAGCTCGVWLTAGQSDSYHWQRERDGLETWLRTLRTPVGLMISDDALVFPLLEACRRLGLSVPNDVAVVGVNNLVSICNMVRPTLTSVAVDRVRIGHEAAVLLDKLMGGADTPSKPTLVSPTGIVLRQSTDTLAIDDPDVAAAVRYVRQHIAEPFGVDVLAREVGGSRRKLETGFRQWLGCSPLQFINRTRVEHAKHLLDTTPRAKLSQIARASGFATVDRLRLLFLKHSALKPSVYRKSLSAPPPAPPARRRREG